MPNFNGASKAPTLKCLLYVGNVLGNTIIVLFRVIVLLGVNNDIANICMVKRIQVRTETKKQNILINISSSLSFFWNFNFYTNNFFMII